MAGWHAHTRRSFLRAGLAGLFLSACQQNQGPLPPPPPKKTRDDNPIADVGEQAARQFFGDEPERFHSLLWEKNKPLADTPPEHTRVVIIGGGLSGLTAVRELVDFRPILLEGASRLGGNAKGQRWGEVPFSIGGAYITRDEDNAPQIQLLRELGLDQKWRPDDPTHDSIWQGGLVHPEFWFGGSDPARKADFRTAWNYFKTYREKTYPDIPPSPNDKAFAELDRRAFQDELKLRLGKSLHPHVQALVREYCWSAFGAQPEELAATAGLNFLAADLGGLYVLPGGNSAISQALVDKLRPQASLRSQAVVTDVRVVNDKVRVSYVDEDKNLQLILADACIVATPKFVARHILSQMPPEQVEAIGQLKYRSVVVASVLVNQPRQPDFHDLYCLAEQKDPAFTDVILATFAQGGHPEKTILNLYHPLPYEGARAELLAANAYDPARQNIENALPDVLKTLKLNPEAVKDVRLSRWGHGMVFPRPGLISSGVPRRASQPLQGRIFFAHQDNWALPCFETAFQSAVEAATEVKKLLLTPS